MLIPNTVLLSSETNMCYIYSFLFSDPPNSEWTKAVFLAYSRLLSQEKYCFSPDSKLLYSRCSKYMTYVTLSFDRKRKN